AAAIFVPQGAVYERESPMAAAEVCVGQMKACLGAATDVAWQFDGDLLAGALARHDVELNLCHMSSRACPLEST
ncbi:MAG: hypothetical protein ACI9U2_004002, partial [Bradymonadia bacterium]